MCFHTKLTADAVKLKRRFQVNVKDGQEIPHSEHLNGFAHPETPVITNEEPGVIQLYQWGLIPHWAKDKKIQDMTLNARIETLDEKPSFSSNLEHRCLVLVDGFYEWKWLDPKGKQKEKYLLALPDDEPFALAGLWSVWKNELGNDVFTYTIITTEAQGIMREIHNSKMRMPVVLKKESERDWLLGDGVPEVMVGLEARLGSARRS